MPTVRVGAWGAMLAAAVLMLGSGCYASHECGGPEECNFEDDDCDFRIDENFRDESGLYVTPEHCGGCGVTCDEVFPTAAETECAVEEESGTPKCRIVECPEGAHRAGDGSCAPDAPALCLPCSEDADCALRRPGARCVELEEGAQPRCLPPCDMGCPPGFECGTTAEGRDACIPTTGSCSCTVETLGAEFACLLERDDSHACAGIRVCREDGLGACQPALGEACNGTDDDCDGETDEDFRDEEGRYVSRLHCGGCASPCVEPGPHMNAECVADDAEPDRTRCVVECEEGFVDVDGVAANGCECERWDGEGPPPAIGGDSDCDGVPDDNDDFIYVTTTGNDMNPGTLARPMRTIQTALEKGQDVGKDVLVARGIYDGGIDVVPGVSVFGGYRPDFRDRDLTLFPVRVERPDAGPGAPVITCRDVTAETRIEGFTVQGSDAVAAGQGSTAVYMDGCGPDVTLRQVTVFAGRGAAGARGDSSSDNLDELGLDSLEQLTGQDGRPGNPSDGDDICERLPGGPGGDHSCPSGDVSGGDGGAAACPDTGCNQTDPCGNAGCTDYTSGGECDFDAVLADAVPNPAPEDGSGPAAGEAGELTYNAPTNRGVCNFCDDNPTLPRLGGNGEDGASGDDGRSGDGCRIGAVLDVDTGRVYGAAGANGRDGTDGSGGGGGSPGAGYAVIDGTSGDCASRSGGSGGGGGSGGCGAPGADGGGGGGASNGIVVRLRGGMAVGPTMDEVRIVTAGGGRGGDGGNGAAGGSGGSGARGGGARFWCARSGGRGGDGGRGGAGGAGGGGCGGGSHGVYIEGGAAPGDYATSLEDGVEVEDTGVPGSGGRGGFSPGGSASDGADGNGEPIFVGL